MTSRRAHSPKHEALSGRRSPAAPKLVSLLQSVDSGRHTPGEEGPGRLHHKRAHGSPQRSGQLRAEAQPQPDHWRARAEWGTGRSECVRGTPGRAQVWRLPCPLMAPGIFPFPTWAQKPGDKPCPHSDYGHQPRGGPQMKASRRHLLKKHFPGLLSASKVLYFTIRVTPPSGDGGV